MQQKVVEHRKSKLDNTNYTLTGFSDCPFWSKKLETEYRAITETVGTTRCIRLWLQYVVMQIERISYHCRTSRTYKEFDGVTGGWYKNRDMVKESDIPLDMSTETEVKPVKILVYWWCGIY